MNFELGKIYIVNVTEKGIKPLMEFDRSQWVNKDYDDLDFLTDEEKEVIVNGVLDKIRAEIKTLSRADNKYVKVWLSDVLSVIDKYRNEVDE